MPHKVTPIIKGRSLCGIFSKARIERVQIGDWVSFDYDNAMVGSLPVATRNFVLCVTADINDMILL